MLCWWMYRLTKSFSERSGRRVLREYSVFKGLLQNAEQGMWGEERGEEAVAAAEGGTRVCRGGRAEGCRGQQRNAQAMVCLKLLFDAQKTKIYIDRSVAPSAPPAPPPSPVPRDVHMAL